MADGTLVFDTKLDTTGVSTGLSSVGSIAKTGLGVAAAGFAAVTAAAVGTTKALADGVTETAAYGDNIDKMSQKMGISAEAYQEWDAVMQHSGASMDSLQGAFKTLAKQTEANAEEFKKLGISEKDLQTMSQEEIFAKTIEGLQGMEEGAERTTIATKLLGKGGMELGALLNTSAEETQAMKDKVHELGGVMSDEAVKAAAAFQDSLQDMQTAFGGLKKNLSSEFLPAVTEVMDGLTLIFSGDTTAGLDKINQGVNELSQRLMDVLPTVVQLGGNIIMSLADAIVQNLPTLITVGLDIINELIAGVVQALPQLLQAAMQIIQGLVDALIANLPQFIDVALQMIVTLAKGIAQALPELIPQTVEVITKIVETLIDNIDLLIDAALELIMGLANGLIKALPKLIEKAPEIIEKLVAALIKNIPKLVKCALDLIIALAGGLIKAIPELVKSIPEIIKAIINGFKDAWPEMKQAGIDMIKGLGEGIINAKDWLVGKVKELCNNALDAIKGFFGIASPSKKFRWIGEMCVEGMEEGFEGINSLTSGVTASLGNIRANVSGGNVSVATNGGFAEALANMLEGMGVYMDGRTVGYITANSVNDALGRFSLRRV